MRQHWEFDSVRAICDGIHKHQRRVYKSHVQLDNCFIACMSKRLSKEQDTLMAASAKKLQSAEDSSYSTSGGGAPAGRPPPCKSWTSGGACMAAIMLCFCHQHPQHSNYVRLFTTMLQSLGWSRCGCKVQETVPYGELHGASVIASNITHFLSRFMIRKTVYSAVDKKNAAAAMSDLLRYCSDNNHLTHEVVKRELERVIAIGRFDAGTLSKSVQSLYDRGYWNKLRRNRDVTKDEVMFKFEKLMRKCGDNQELLQLVHQRIQELDEQITALVESQQSSVGATAEPCPASAVAASFNTSACVDVKSDDDDGLGACSDNDNEDDDDDDDDNNNNDDDDGFDGDDNYDFDDDDDGDDDVEENHDDSSDDDACIKDAGGMEIKEVRTDGWVMGRALGGRSYSRYGKTTQDDVFLLLPRHIAAQGRPCVSFWGMALVLRNGIWSPKGTRRRMNHIVCSHVLPPQPHASSA